MSTKIRVRDIADAMNHWAPQGYAFDWDSVGLQCGHPDAEITKILTCLTPSEEALKAAKKAKAEMVVAHHPLIFRPLKHLRENSPAVRLALDYAAAKVACFTAHTNLDVVRGGVSYVLAEALGLQQPRVLFPSEHVEQLKLVVFVPETHMHILRDAIAQAGGGVIGNYTHCSYSSPGKGTFMPGAGAQPFLGNVGEVNEERERRFETLVPAARIDRVLRAMRDVHPYEEPAYDLVPLKNINPDIGLGVRGELPEPVAPQEFAGQIRQALPSPGVRWVDGKKKTIQRIAVLGGSGGSDIARVPHDVDAYVTGDVKYHDADLARARGLHVFDAGHVATEVGIAPVVAEYLKGRIKGLKTAVYTEPEPFTFETQ